MTKPFSFANLLGGGQRSRAAAEDEDEDKDKASDEEADDAAGNDDKDGDEGDDDSARRAVLAERGRIAAILALATPETVAQAAALATQTDLTVEQAGAVLAAAPNVSGALSERMRGRGAAPLPQASAGPGDGLPPELKAAQARRASKER